MRKIADIRRELEYAKEILAHERALLAQLRDQGFDEDHPTPGVNLAVKMVLCMESRVAAFQWVLEDK